MKKKINLYWFGDIFYCKVFASVSSLHGDYRQKCQQIKEIAEWK